MKNKIIAGVALAILLVGGYMIVSADSLEEATEIARQCPGVVGPKSSVEVREIHTP